MIYYFAYGSNMNKAQMEKRGVFFVERFSGTLLGWKLGFSKINPMRDDEGFANVFPNDASEVQGVVYQLIPNAINVLDSFEHAPKQYARHLIPIRTKGGILECQIYIAQPDWTDHTRKPRRDYLDHLLKGKEFLSPEYWTQLSLVKTIG